MTVYTKTLLTLSLILSFKAVSVHCQQASPRIIGSNEAPRGRFPYMCSLRNNGNRKHACGGVVVAGQWVLTAAHCVDPAHERTVGKAPIIYCGIHEIVDDDPTKTFFAVDSCLHKFWTGTSSDGYDIALVKLDKATTLTPARLNPKTNQIGTRQDLAAIGWGVTHPDGTRPAPTLQIVERLRLTTRFACNRAWEFVEIKEGLMICTAAVENKDTCQGDSGGPLLITDKIDDDLAMGTPRGDLIIGITSFGDTECGNGRTPAVYTNVGHYMQWIQDVIAGKTSECRSIFAPDLGTEEIITELESDNAQGVQRILDDGLSANSVHNDGSLPNGAFGDSLLHWAVRLHAVESAKVLIDAGASTEKENINGEKPLHYCGIYTDTDDIAKLLLRNDANVDSRTTRRLTPLHYATREGRSRIVRILLLNGADVDAADETGLTALMLASQRDRASAARLLILSGANVDAVSDNGYTALMFASAEGHLEVVQVLIDSGASKTNRQNTGRNALLLVCTSSNAQCDAVTKSAIENLVRP